MDDPDAASRRDVGSGEHAAHTIDRVGSVASIADVGSRMIGEPQRAVQQPSGSMSSMKSRVPIESSRPSYFMPRVPTPFGLHDDGHVVLSKRLDGIEHLDVAGAATEVRTEVARRLFAGERCPVLVDQCLGPHDDAGRAEPALQRTTRRECVGHTVDLVGGPCPRA